jgi:hypothetical protein
VFHSSIRVTALPPIGLSLLSSSCSVLTPTISNYCSVVVPRSPLHRLAVRKRVVTTGLSCRLPTHCRHSRFGTQKQPKCPPTRMKRERLCRRKARSRLRCLKHRARRPLSPCQFILRASSRWSMESRTGGAQSVRSDVPPQRRFVHAEAMQVQLASRFALFTTGTGALPLPSLLWRTCIEPTTSSKD